MSRTKIQQRVYMNKYYANPENRRIKQVRDNDRNAYKAKKWITKMPAWMHLDHVWGKTAKNAYSPSTKKQLIPAKKNLAKAAKTTKAVLSKKKTTKK